MRPAATVTPKLVILGRDGTLNIFRDDHVKDPAEWHPIPGALEAVAKLNQAGWHAVVATNQAGIGRGLVDISSVNAVHAHMIKLLLARGGRLDAVFFCPHAPEEACDCRKPQPGMMLDIGRRWGVDLAQVPMASDTLRDMLAAQAAGCEPHLIRSGRSEHLDDLALQEHVRQVPALRVHDSLGAFASHLIKRTAAASSSDGRSAR
jgi:D-glycero-D-manno-heptose 1,7-bisphosphate phosphatase